jgi:hypothetical protein
MAGAMRAPDPALLDHALVPAGDAGLGRKQSAPLSQGAVGNGASSSAAAPPEEKGVLRVGPLSIGTATLQRQFRLRQVRFGRLAARGDEAWRCS